AAPQGSNRECVSCPTQKDGLGLPVPARRTPSWGASPEEDSGCLSFPPEQPGLRPRVPGNLASAVSPREEEEERDENDADSVAEGLRSEEHPSQFFAEAQRLWEQGLLLDEEVSVAGRVYGVHRVILAVLTFAYQGVLGPAARGDVLAAAEALGAPRVEAAARRRREGPGNTAEEEAAPSPAEELRENLRGIERLYREGVGCDLELEADGFRLRGEGLR
uniref:BTB domain-containing protein n=1 Tax=Cavia porcellus TaxID=10141 RepID=A0A286XEK6_CAVPO